MDPEITAYIDKLRNTFGTVTDPAKQALINNYLTELTDLFKNLRNNTYPNNLRIKANQLATRLGRGLNMKTKTLDEIKKQMNENINDVKRLINEENNKLKKDLSEARRTMYYYNTYNDLPGSDKLREKQKKLSEISSTISTRDRLIQINEEQTKLNRERIKSLRRFYVPLIAGIIIFALLWSRYGIRAGFIGFGTVILMYIFYLLYVFNFLNIRYVFSPEAEKIKQVIKYAEDKLDDEYMLIKRKIAEYTNENCLCPEKEKDKLEKIPDYEGPERSYNEDTSQYYYDGTAPMQRYDLDGNLEDGDSKNKTSITWTDQ
tara:strand:- start:659 stop:1609 length:951 start_codon:yes stop_codon:yes gene_type:complete